ncbi:VOC family protein [uncultured Algimonas sp.]|uniref:VOC family protein n=1 Tax=uncultured Algimonas sp. TaxID=1547920 RepID=UPI00260D0ADD|nr:VOC family protein [uncultured Algimonas sp.]
MPLTIDYVEFASPDLEGTQRFFAEALGWSFTDYGPDYRDIQNAGTGAGVERGGLRPPLIVLKSDDLVRDRAKLLEAGAELVRDIFEFPGGRRFEFREPGGTLMAAWTQSAAP